MILLTGGGGMRGFIQGGAWFYLGGVHGFIWGVCGFMRGACVVLFGGVVLFRGACVVLFGGGLCVFFSFFGYNEIQSMSGRYASYWNAFLFWFFFTNWWKSLQVMAYQWLCEWTVNSFWTRKPVDSCTAVTLDGPSPRHAALFLNTMTMSIVSWFLPVSCSLPL